MIEYSCYCCCHSDQVEPFSTVVVFGLGAVGLAVVQGAKALNCTKIVGVDTNPKKFEIAKQLLV